MQPRLAARTPVRQPPARSVTLKVQSASARKPTATALKAKYPTASSIDISAAARALHSTAFSGSAVLPDSIHVFARIKPVAESVPTVFLPALGLGLMSPTSITLCTDHQLVSARVAEHAAAATAAGGGPGTGRASTSSAGSGSSSVSATGGPCGNAKQFKEYAVDRVFDAAASQEAVYDALGRPLVAALLAGRKQLS